MLRASLLFVFLCSLSVLQSVAAEPLQVQQPPAWGSIHAANAALDRFTFQIEQWPTDERLIVPAGFPQIVRATLQVGDHSEELIVELNADATDVAVLLPKAARSAVAVVAVETAEISRQFDDGRIVFTAADARIVGHTAKLEQHPGNSRIGFWSNAADHVEWSYNPTRWGMYDVSLTYSTASPSGSVVEVEIGSEKVTGRLVSTGSWYRYAVVPLGRMSVEATKGQTLTVRCTDMVGGAFMNLKAVTLSPACEGQPPVQADDGVVTLHGRDATVLGTSLRYEPAEEKQTLGFWTRPTDAARWSFTVTQPAEFDVEVLQGCGPGQGGSVMTVAFDAGRPAAPMPLEFTVEATGGFQDFRGRIIGRVGPLAAGQHTLTVVPKQIAKQAACDIRQVRLLPVKP